jgi:hypothetical protein
LDEFHLDWSYGPGDGGSSSWAGGSGVGSGASAAFGASSGGFPALTSTDAKPGPFDPLFMAGASRLIAAAGRPVDPGLTVPPWRTLHAKNGRSRLGKDYFSDQFLILADMRKIRGSCAEIGVFFVQMQTDT